MKKRALSAALLALLLLQTASCAASDGTAGEDTVTGTAQETEAVTTDKKTEEKNAYFAALPAVSAAGAEITFAAINIGSEDMGDNDISTAEENGAKMNDAIYQREREVEERLGVSIVCSGFDDDSALQTAVSNDTLSGEGIYDIINAKTTVQ
ncbi:MAG: hypothetical protein IJ302_09345, partial [Clostridia bacterium]|nr:hypothetical protein [Clostridia bacterium]